MIPSRTTTIAMSSVSSHKTLFAASTVLRSTGRPSRICRPYKQIRAFKVGLWSAYLDPEFQRELKRRQRASRHNYIEILHRKLSWDRQVPFLARRVGLKRFMCSAWRSQDLKLGGRWVDEQELEAYRNGLSRDGGIEDVERGPVERLLKRQQRKNEHLAQASSQLSGWSCDTAHEGHTESATYRHGFKRSPRNSKIPKPEPEYEIDPITNRKVFKSESKAHAEVPHNPVDTPLGNFKDYNSHFQGIYQTQNPESIADAKEYETKEYQPFFHNEPDRSPAKKSTPTQDGLEDYDGKTTYKAFRYNEPDGKIPEPRCPVQQGLEEFDAKVNYTAFRFNEPDGKLPESPDIVREGLKDYDRKVTYGAVRYNEPDGRTPEMPCPVQEGLTEYDEKANYSGRQGKEPTENLPKRPDPIEQGLKDYDARNSYGPFWAKEPDGRDTEKSCPVQEGLKEYDSKVCYSPGTPFPTKEGLKRYEPKSNYDRNTQIDQNSQFSDPTRAGLKDFDDRIVYGISQNATRGIIPPYRFDMTQRAFERGADAVPKSPRHSKENSSEDLDLLRASDVRARFNNGTELKSEMDVQNLTQRQELKYDICRIDKVGEASAQKLPVAQNTSIPRKTVEDLRRETKEIQTNVTKAREKVNAKILDVEAGWMDQKQPRKATGTFTRDFPEEFEATRTADSGNLSSKKVDPWGYDMAPQGLELSYKQEVEKDVQRKGTAAMKDHSDNQGVGTMKLETALDRNPSKAKLSGKMRLANEKDPYSKEPTGLETSYTGECKARRLQAQKDPYSKEPQGLETSYQKECAKQETEKRIRLTEAEVDPYSKTPQGLELSYEQEMTAKQGEGDLSMLVSAYGLPKSGEGENANPKSPSTKELRKRKDKELVHEIRSIYESAYGTIDCEHRQKPDVSDPQKISPSPGTQETTLYKILAYDPTMQSINTAETTSIVPDSTSPLNPAEVLLRLSNPAKFFPHFAPLQSQGYEIVSGSGDVLIFRKVHSVAPRTIQSQKRTSTNPIDGMQPIAATGNFASPTGFVNHDILDASDPPFKSNIDVRREEPVFSGKSTWQDKETQYRNKKNGGTGKRLLIGATWVAACSYAVGVVAEFFKTGGIDGRGPQGF